MASYNYTFTSGDTVTPTKLNSARTVSEIVNADVSATAAIAGTKVVPAFGAQDITVGTANRSITNTGNFALAFGTNNTERVRIDNAGNVGIGVSPSEKLDVLGSQQLRGSTTETVSLQIGQARTGNGFAIIDLIGDATNSDYGMRLVRGNSGQNTTSSIVHKGTGEFQIQAEDAAPVVIYTSNTQRMRIDASGNVGIGTTTPAAPLTLSGAATHFSLVNTSAATDNKNWNWVTTATNLRLRAISDAGAAGGHTFEFVRSSNLVNEFAGYNSGAAWFTINNDLQRVGVGTASPNAAAMLDVSSTTKGFLPPRMTTAQRDAISSPAAGLVIYNTSTNVLNFYNGSAWGAV